MQNLNSIQVLQVLAPLFKTKTSFNIYYFSGFFAPTWKTIYTSSFQVSKSPWFLRLIPASFMASAQLVMRQVYWSGKMKKGAWHKMSAGYFLLHNHNIHMHTHTHTHSPAFWHLRICPEADFCFSFRSTPTHTHRQTIFSGTPHISHKVVTFYDPRPHTYS